MKTGILWSTLLLSGCLAPSRQQEPETIELAWRVPRLKPAAETSETQIKGGVRITVATPAYEPQIAYVTHDTPLPGRPGPIPGMWLQQQGVKYFERRVVPAATIEPANLLFSVRVSNELNPSRVLRLAGSVVSLNVGGKLAALDPSGYAEFTNSLVPPGTEFGTTIVALPLSQLANESLVGLFIYDVPTKTDAAGNITERQNFEWYYDVVCEPRMDRAEVRTQLMEQKL